MPSCFVYGCSSGYKKGVKVHLFKIPKNCSETVRDKWTAVLRKVRTDIKYNPNNKNHLICHIHFEDKYIVKEDVVVVRGAKNVIPRQHWTISCDSVPTIFPTIPRNPIKSSPLKRKPPSERGQGAKRVKTLNISYGASTSTVVDPIESPKDVKSLVSETLGTTDNDGQLIRNLGLGIVDKVQTDGNPVQPETRNHVDLVNLKDVIFYWNSSCNSFLCWELKHIQGPEPEACYLLNMSYSELASVQRQIKIFPDLSFQVYVGVERLEWNDALVAHSVLSGDHLTAILNHVSGLNLCRGVAGYGSIPELNNAKKIGDTWFANACEKIGANMTCVPCRKLSNHLYQKQFRTITSPKLNEKRSGIQGYKRRLKRLLSKQRTSRMELFSLRNSLKRLDVTIANSQLAKLTMDHGTKMTIMEAVRAAKAKSATGIRYSTEWLLESTLLKIKSPAAYKHLRDTKILPLPHPSTVKRLISGSPCEFGFNQVSLQAVQREFNGKIRRDKQGVLVFDEIKLRKSLDFNKGTLKFDGYVNYGEFTENFKNGCELADHALVFLFRPYNSNWVQPIAVFATKGAAKGGVLAKLVVECIVRLEAVGAEVVATVSDGATTNKNLWKNLGISGVKGKVVNKIVHPCDEKRYLYFGSDVPHIIKCIRNHFEKYKSVLGQPINYSFYEELFRVDNLNAPGMRKCPKLTKAHIWPNAFQKMRVNLAAQLLSESVKTGLRFYREVWHYNRRNFEGSENTENFTARINYLFDILNSTLPKDGLTLKSNEMLELRNFYDILESDSKNTFASPQTIESLRVAIKSTIEITEYLIEELRFSYVLTSKLNQDCLEKFFGLVRAAGGHEEHPTVPNFIQLFRLLSIYTPIKRIVHGNVNTNEKQYVLVNFADSMKKLVKNSKASKSEIQQRWESELRKKLATRFHFKDKRFDMTTDTPSSSVIDKNLVYHLTGFLVKKSHKLLKCKYCISSLYAGEVHPPESYLTDLLTNEGRLLTRPSNALFQLISSSVEPAVNLSLMNGDLYGDALLNVISNIEKLSPASIGCDEDGHGTDVLTKLIPYYITTRFHFYSNSVKQDMRRFTNTKRKLSKLQSS